MKIKINARVCRFFSESFSCLRVFQRPTNQKKKKMRTNVMCRFWRYLRRPRVRRARGETKKLPRPKNPPGDEFVSIVSFRRRAERTKYNNILCGALKNDDSTSRGLNFRNRLLKALGRAGQTKCPNSRPFCHHVRAYHVNAFRTLKGKDWKRLL